MGNKGDLTGIVQTVNFREGVSANLIPKKVWSINYGRYRSSVSVTSHSISLFLLAEILFYAELGLAHQASPQLTCLHLSV